MTMSISINDRFCAIAKCHPTNLNTALTTPQIHWDCRMRSVWSHRVPWLTQIWIRRLCILRTTWCRKGHKYRKQLHSDDMGHVDPHAAWPRYSITTNFGFKFYRTATIWGNCIQKCLSLFDYIHHYPYHAQIEKFW